MRTRIMLLVALVLLASAARAETVTFGPEKLPGYLAHPEGKGPFPAVIVIHEWWGLNDWARQQADRLARQGYVGLAVDLYRGQVTDDREVAHELSRGLPADRALSDMRAAVAYLKTRPEVRKDRIGAIGWCMGGGYALDLALAEPLKATVVAYGRVPASVEALKPLRGAVLGIFGEKDRGIPVEGVKAFEANLKKAGKRGQVIVYPGVGHAFMNQNNRQGYDEKAAREAWGAIDAFLAKELKG